MSQLDYVNEPVRSSQQLLDDLMQANGFTEKDLAANRAGAIGSGQISRLIQQILRPLVKSIAVVAGWLLVILAAGWAIHAGIHRDAPLRELNGVVFVKLFVLFRGLYLITFVRIGAMIMLISCLGALILTLAKTSVKLTSLLRDMAERKAVVCEGRVYPTQEEGRGSPWDAAREQWTRVRQERPKTYAYAVHDLSLDVSYEGFRALASGSHYKVYYTPRSKLLLSIEPTMTLPEKN